MDWQPHIEVDPETCHGKARLAGTRIPLSVVLDFLASGSSVEEIVDAFPSATGEAVCAVMSYAADLAHGRCKPLPI